MKFHHIGIACSDMEQAVSQFKTMHQGAREVSDVVFDPEQNAYLQLLEMPEGSHFEFVSGPAVASFLGRKIELYHTCFETPEFEDSIDHFIRQKAIPLGAAKPAILFNGRRVIFLKTLFGIVELLEA